MTFLPDHVDGHQTSQLLEMSGLTFPWQHTPADRELTHVFVRICQALLKAAKNG